ncbi:MAG: beta-L-arabinofuranosidase domain-containing protein [Thermoguttaceae bacterium]|jgi:DUF1680 family protein
MTCIRPGTILAGLLVALAAPGQEPDYPIRPVPPGSVKVQDTFWAPRLEKNRAVTIPHNLQQLEKQGSLNGFAVLAGQTAEKYHGYMWGDSDVYKTLEGIFYSLRDHSDRALEDRVERILRTIAGAQAADGYLMPHLQIAEPGYRHFSHETTRTCESYSMGHMIESAVGHYETTGSKKFLDVAVKCADLLARVQAEGKYERISGHPEIELALVRLYRATRERKYLELARAYVANARSKSISIWSGGKPFLEDEVARGHAVAAVYLYCGATDVAVLTGDAGLLRLLDGKWLDVVSRKLYLTGGTGLPAGEAFGQAYELPNARAYCETCAAVANIFWNYRLFLAHGDGKYLDVLERTLYNGFLSGVGMSGDRFFYLNPLACLAGSRSERFSWHGCPCCPTNIVRFLPQIAGYVLAARGEEVFVNLYVQGEGQLCIAGQTVALRQETRYPWDGRVKIVVEPKHPAEFAIRVRIPGWSREEPVPSDLYRYLAPTREKPDLKINGRTVPLDMQSGFALVRRIWKAGDTIELALPMPIRRVVAHEAVAQDSGRVALERGPIVYCLEGVDHGGHVHNLVLSDETKLAAEHRDDLLGGITVLTGEAKAMQGIPEGQVSHAPVRITAVPYYAWNYRGPGEMAVWIARAPEKATPWPQPRPQTIAGSPGR